MKNPFDHLWLAADVKTRIEFLQLVRPLEQTPLENVKIRRHLTDAAGMAILDNAAALGFSVFDDAKLYDIPASMANDVDQHLRRDITALNCLAECGLEAMAMMAGKCAEAGVESIAVTVLTSKNFELCMAQYRRKPAEQVVVLARHAADAGIDSILCAPADLETLEKAGLLDRFKRRYTPGIRPWYTQSDDQVRVMTPTQALQAGSTDLIMCRPIYGEQYGPVEENLERITDEMMAD